MSKTTKKTFYMRLYEKRYWFCDMTEQSRSIGGWRTGTATKNGRYLLVPPKKVNLNFPLGIGVLHLIYGSKSCNLAWIFFSSQSGVLISGTSKEITGRAQLLMILAATAYTSRKKIISIFSIVWTLFPWFLQHFCHFIVSYYALIGKISLRLDLE